MQNVVNFEDLYFLFGLNIHNRNIIRMDLDEASYLYKLVKNLKNPTCIEIGTYLGGSAILMAGAGGNIITVDNYSSKTFNNITNPISNIKHTLKKYGLFSKVQFIYGNSKTYDNSKMYCDLLLIDGNHTYESVKLDYEHWKNTVKNGGHILFHDACKTRDEATIKKEVYEFVRTLKLKKIKEIGSLIHFIKEE
jgi:predicted O-methyltransferase YrrM